MGFFMQFGLTLGLAGASGVRAYFPLIIMGLLTRYSENVTYRPPFGIFASVPMLLILLILAAFEILNGRIADYSDNQSVILVLIRASGGAIIFAGLFPGLGVIGGLLFGGAVATLAYLITVRFKQSSGRLGNRQMSANASAFEEIAAISGTVLAIILPWTSYFIWGAVLFFLIKKARDSNNRYSTEKTKSWR